MSDTPKSAPASAPAAAPAAKSESNAAAKTADAAPASSGGDTGKSARDSVGGAAVGHYGYFSNIKTPEYKSGWDDIWGKPAKSGKPGATKKAAGSKKVAPKKQEPRVVSLDFEDLPAGLQAGLAAAARAQLKKLRVSYDARDKAGAVRWRLDCTVDR